jgi:hypothetical protein
MDLTQSFKDTLKFKVEVEAGDLDTNAVAVIDLASAVEGSDATGFADDTTAYKMDIDLNASTNNVSVLGSAAQTYTTLLAEINTDLTDMTATLSADGTQIVITADNGGANTITITDGTSEALIDSLTVDATIGTSTPGTEGTISITIDNDATNSGYTDCIYSYQVATTSTNVEKTGLVSSYSTSTGLLTISDNGSTTELADGDIIYGWAVLV